MRAKSRIVNDKLQLQITFSNRSEIESMWHKLNVPIHAIENYIETNIRSQNYLESSFDELGNHFAAWDKLDKFLESNTGNI